MFDQRLAAGALALLATFSFAPRASTQTPDGLTPSDMTSLRAAYEHGRHRVFERENGTHQARTHHQQFSTTFDGRSAVITPDEGDWTFGLELVRYGFEEHEVEVSGSPRTELDGCRLAYAWDDVVTEWYVNQRDGLEHGFTVSERPNGADSGSTLRFDLRLLGNLAASVDADGLGLSLFDARGELAATYAGLVVTDARGLELDARMATTSTGLSILVDESGAAYPLTIDPTVQQAYVKASNTGANDQFGASVAIDGDTVVVGAPGEDSDATGVNGSQANNWNSNSGAAYVFTRSGSTWVQEAYLKPTYAIGAAFPFRFGSSVAIDGDTVVVGAPQGSTYVGTSGYADNVGVIYIFRRSGSTWTHLTDFYATFLDHFGASVDIDGDTIVVGAPGEDSNATGVNGNDADESADGAGAAYVITLSGTSWVAHYLKASNTDSSDEFGVSVAIDGDTVVVGAHTEDSHATGVNGDESNNSSLNSGAVYVFKRDGSTWAQEAYLKASNTVAFDYFGTTVAIDTDTIVVGAPYEFGGAGSSGAAYVFTRSGSTWAQQAYLKASNMESFDVFGGSVAIAGDTVLVGATGEDSNATGVNGNQASNSSPLSGAVYVFTRSASIWSQEAYLKASNTGSIDYFGTSMAIDGTTLVVSAVGEDSSATGVNGNQTNNSFEDPGAVYIFDLAALQADWSIIPGCHGNTASFVQPTTPAQINSTVPIDLHGSVVNDGLVVTYLGTKGIDSMGCGFQLSPTEELLLEHPPFPRFYGVSIMTGGVATIPLTLPNHVGLVGLEFTLQSIVIDTTLTGSGPTWNPTLPSLMRRMSGFAREFSDGLEFVIRP